MSTKVLFGFHAVTVRLKTAPESVVEIHVDATRRDARMRQFVERAQAAGAKLVDSDDQRLIRLAGSPRHQGVVARVTALATVHSLDDVLDAVSGAPLVLVLDGVTGTLVSVEQPDELAAALQRYLSEPERRSLHGAAARPARTKRGGRLTAVSVPWAKRCRDRGGSVILR